MIRSLNTILIVPAIEPALPTWRALGWQPVAEVPHGGRLGFAILSDGERELTLQTAASFGDDLGISPVPAVVLYAEVDDLDASAVGADCDVLIERRTTAYGAEERWFRDPSGTVIGFVRHLD